MLAIACLSAAVVLGTPTQAKGNYDPGHAGFAVTFRDKTVPFTEFGITMMPGESAPIVVPGGGQARFHLDIDGGRLSQSSQWEWLWTAPASPGLQRVDVYRDDGVRMRLNIFVMRPAAEVRDGMLNGYRIGDYPAKPLRGNRIYLPPRGFVEVTPELLNVAVSPHFTLGQFLCKQQPGHWPKYLVLREQLPYKLEQILQEVNNRGIRTDDFHIMSGYRTPWYNASIGNAQYSRHLWGGAADIFVDTQANGRMDDLTGDGKSSLEDARMLYTITDELAEEPDHRPYVGGLGLYGARPHRGPFLHVDARGNPAYWQVP